MNVAEEDRLALSSDSDASWQKLLERPYARMHFVQLYESQASSLAANVGLYVSEGLRRGDGILVICAQEHRSCFCEHIQVRPAERQLIWMDADDTLARFMRGSQPDRAAFERSIAGALAQVRPQTKDGRIRAYGEMVGILWNERQYDAAVQLETLWNRLMADSAFSLYCGYSMDIFDTGAHHPALEKVVCAHSHLIPSEPTGHLKRSLWHAMEDVLGEKSHEIRNLNMTNRHASWVVVPEAEAMMMWLSTHAPEQLPAIIERTRDHFNQTADFLV